MWQGGAGTCIEAHIVLEYHRPTLGDQRAVTEHRMLSPTIVGPPALRHIQCSGGCSSTSRPALSTIRISRTMYVPVCTVYRNLTHCMNLSRGVWAASGHQVCLRVHYLGFPGK